MKKLIPAVIFLAFLGISAYAKATDGDGKKKANELKTVSFVDLKRYAGTWYEIAKYPNKFQKQCVGNTTANYNLKPNGDVEVVNKCLKKDGTMDDATGKAKIVDRQTNAKLKVSFFWVFYAPYYVIDLGENYEYAVVGEPDREYLWILSRQPEMNDATYQKILRKVETLGYNPAKLVKTPQDMKTVKGAVVGE